MTEGENVTLERFATDLYNADAVRFTDITLTSGKKSNLYFSVKDINSSVACVETFIQAMTPLVAQFHFDRLADIKSGASFLVGALRYRLKLSGIEAVLETRTHGIIKQINGRYNKGDEVLLVEDVLSTGGTLESALKILTSHQLSIKNILVWINRQEGGKERLEKLGFKVHHLFTKSELLNFYKASGLVSEKLLSNSTDTFKTSKEI